VADRSAVAAKVAAIAAPLAGGLVFGSWLAISTRSWGGAFILWPLLWWCVVAVVAGMLAFRIGSAVSPIFTRSLAGDRLERAGKITDLACLLGIAVFLVGLTAAIWVMVAGKTASAPVELYWVIPLGVFVYASTRPADNELLAMRRENDDQARRRRCAELTSRQRLAFDYHVLRTVHSLAAAGRPIAVSEVEGTLSHECAPELLPATLQAWADRKFVGIADSPRRHDAYHFGRGSSSDSREVWLTALGRRISARAEQVGLGCALADHEQCLELDDDALMGYRDELFGAIVSLIGNRDSATLNQLLSVHVHPYAATLADSMLDRLAKLGLISVVPRSGFAIPLTDGQVIRLTLVGRQIGRRLADVGTLAAALTERDETALQEAERKQRCAQTTSQQRIEFEDRFLRELHQLTGGDTRQVRLEEIWSRLNDECAAELTSHAVRVWRERKCVSYPERFDDLLPYERAEISLTAAGRDLCVRAEELRSMQAALKERSEEYRVKQEYNFQNSQVGAVGPHADVHDNEFVQSVNGIDQIRLDELAEQLAELRRALIDSADSADRGVAVGAVSQAEIAARNGDQAGVWANLARAGKWVLDTAKEIGVDLAAEAITTALRTHNIPI
jgi:hypothetical protein